MHSICVYKCFLHCLTPFAPYVPEHHTQALPPNTTTMKKKIKHRIKHRKHGTRCTGLLADP